MFQKKTRNMILQNQMSAVLLQEVEVAMASTVYSFLSFLSLRSNERPTIYQLVHSLWLMQSFPCRILPHWGVPSGIASKLVMV